jgi:hypothetical protein
VTRPAPRASRTDAPARTVTPRDRTVRASTRAASASSWRSISRGPRWTSVTGRPPAASPQAVSRPSTPPPSTTAHRAPPASARIWAQSASVRNATAPASSRAVAAGQAVGGWHHRSAAGRKHEHVVRNGRTVRHLQQPSRPVNPYRGHPRQQRHAAGRVPVLARQLDAVDASLAREHVRQLDAVVGPPGSSPTTMRPNPGSSPSSSCTKRKSAIPLPTMTTLGTREVTAPPPAARRTP